MTELKLPLTVRQAQKICTKFTKSRFFRDYPMLVNLILKEVGEKNSIHDVRSLKKWLDAREMEFGPHHIIIAGSPEPPSKLKKR